MVGNVLNLLLWLFQLAIGGMVFMRAYTLFQDAETSMEAWVKLAIGAIFLIGGAVIFSAVGMAGFAHVTALLH